MRNVLAFLAVLVLVGALVGPLSGTAVAQMPMLWGVSYNVSYPTGNTNDFIDKISFRGMGLHARKYLNTDNSVGGSVSWNVFALKETGTWDDGGRTLTGTQMRDINAVPIYVNYFHYFGDELGWRFLVGLNAGTMYVDQRVDVGIFRFDENQWQFAFAPEIGFMMPYDAFLGFVDLRYNVSLEAGEVEGQSYLELIIGFGLR